MNSKPKICPKCQKTYDEGNSFCSLCGSPLVDNPEYLKEAEEIRLNREAKDTADKEYKELVEKYAKYFKAAGISTFLDDYPDYRFRHNPKCYFGVLFDTYNDMYKYYEPTALAHYVFGDHYLDEIPTFYPPQESIRVVKEALFYLAFLNTTKNEVIKVLIEKADELNKAYSAFPLATYKEWASSYRSLSSFTYCSNIHVINTLDYIGIFINGGSKNEVSWRYSYTGNLKSRINKYVTYENDLMKAGVNALKLFMEITAAKLDMVGIDKHYRRFLKNDYRAGVDGHHPFSQCSIDSNRFLTSDDEMKTI